MLDRLFQLLDKIVDFPFGAGRAWRRIAGKSMSEAHAFNLNADFIVVLLVPVVGIVSLWREGHWPIMEHLALTFFFVFACLIYVALDDRIRRSQ